MAAIICADCPKTSLIDNVKGRCATCYSRYLRSKKRTKSFSCEVCKFGFQSARRDARFCSDACRQWSYRERRLLRMGRGGQISGVMRVRTGGPPSHAKCSELIRKAHLCESRRLYAFKSLRTFR